MSSSDSGTASHLIDDVATRIKGFLHSDIEAEVKKEAGGEGGGGATRVILHERAGPPIPAPYDTEHGQHASPASSITQRWDSLRHHWAHLSDARKRQAQAHPRLADEVEARSKTRAHMAQSRLALAQRWEELGDVRLQETQSTQGLEEDQRDLEAQRLKVGSRDGLLRRMEREAEEDERALEEEQMDLARAWVEFCRVEERVKRVYAA